jgi:hypothetical protein
VKKSRMFDVGTSAQTPTKPPGMLRLNATGVVASQQAHLQAHGKQQGQGSGPIVMISTEPKQSIIYHKNNSNLVE